MNVVCTLQIHQHRPDMITFKATPAKLNKQYKTDSNKDTLNQDIAVTKQSFQMNDVPLIKDTVKQQTLTFNYSWINVSIDLKWHESESQSRL